MVVIYPMVCCDVSEQRASSKTWSSRAESHVWIWTTTELSCSPAPGMMSSKSLTCAQMLLNKLLGQYVCVHHLNTSGKQESVFSFKMHHWSLSVQLTVLTMQKVFFFFDFLFFTMSVFVFRAQGFKCGADWTRISFRWVLNICPVVCICGHVTPPFHVSVQTAAMWQEARLMERCMCGMF